VKVVALITLLIGILVGTAFAADPPLDIGVISKSGVFIAGEDVEVELRITNTGASRFIFYTGDLSAQYCWGKSGARAGTFGCGGTVSTCVTGARINPASGSVECAGTNCSGRKIVLEAGESQSVTVIVVVPERAAGKGNIGRLLFSLSSILRDMDAEPEAWHGNYEFARQPVVVRAKDTVLRATK
jgi:hypothetical protein